MKERIITISILLVIVASSLYFGLPRLQHFSGVDEPYWSYDRVPDFWDAVREGKWERTDICDKPGVPLAIISGAGLPAIGEDPGNYESLRYEPKTPEQVQRIGDIYFYLRLPVFLFTLAVLPLFYWLIKKLLGKITARFSLIFIGLSPILFGISLIINSDSILWILTGLSTLSLFVFFKKNERKYLVLSGFFLGLSVITKYVANILFVYFFLIFLLEYIFLARKIPVGEYMKKALFNYAILFSTAMATAFVFFPAAWEDFSELTKATVQNDVFEAALPLFAGVIGLLAVDILALKAGFSTALFDYLAKYKIVLTRSIAVLFLFLSLIIFLHVFTPIDVYDIQGNIASPKGIGDESILKTFPRAILADLYSLLFSISPLVLLSLLFAVAGLLNRKEVGREKMTIFYVLVFMFIFYLGSAVNDVITTVRYQIMVYPLAFVAAAIGISQFLDIDKVRKYIALPAAYLAVIIVLLGSLFWARPHFLAYASEILPDDFLVNLKGMGEGSIEAAYFLNNIPGAEEMKIWSDKGAVCERFVGKCFIDFKKKTFEENQIAYFVVSTDRRSRSLKMSSDIDDVVDFEEIYASQDYTYKDIISNNPNNFVKIFKASQFLDRN